MLNGEKILITGLTGQVARRGGDVAKDPRGLVGALPGGPQAHTQQYRQGEAYQHHDQWIHQPPLDATPLVGQGHKQTEAEHHLNEPCVVGNELVGGKDRPSHHRCLRANVYHNG